MNGASLGREWLASNLPHQGAMNLLEAIVDWDDAGLRAVPRTHADRVRLVECSNESVLRDIDTPGDYGRWFERAGFDERAADAPHGGHGRRARARRRAHRSRTR